jgi:hypothetical protein
VAPGGNIPTLVKQCYCIDTASDSPYVEQSINILDGGGIYFVEDPGKTIDFQVSALLIEKGGTFQAGSATQPFGTDGGKLTIGLYGDDPTNQGKVQPAGAGIRCQTTDSPDDTVRCFPQGVAPGNYCTGSADNPCTSTTAPAKEPLNKRLESYGTLNFDTNSFGYKVLAVAYGGTLNLFGYKGAKPLQDPTWGQNNDSNDHCVVPSVAQSTLDSAEMQAWANLTGSSWGRLTGSASGGNDLTVLTIDRALPDWQVGDDIVIGSTDWYPSHSEHRTVKDCPQNGVSGNTTKLCVDTLKYPHYDQIFDTKTLVANNQATFTNPVNRSAVDLRATVGLLSRSIKVYSLGDAPKRNASDPGFPEVKDCLSTNTNADCYFGGHVIARQGFSAVRIQGVEFKQLGQGGRMGHYPVHFHLAKSTAYTPNGAFIKDSSVWDSMTRFVTVHGTHEVTVARNVGFLSLGHGYYIEDGSEIENLLCHNLGVSARAALQQYVTTQAQPEHWCGNSPPAAARYIPPILDGVAENSTTGPAAQQLGSDSYMPTMFWMMNAYNEFVGNAAVGVHGFGSCYWLLGSAVSGPSAGPNGSGTIFDGYAGFNTTGYQAPLLRFRGNTCTSAHLALPSQTEIDPSAPYNLAASSTGYTAIPNPYLSLPIASKEFLRPIVNGNFRPIPQGAGGFNCTSTNPAENQLELNTKTCVATVIDRFATSYNWAQVNFSSVWLRPWFYLFSNGAITDQLFAGLTFVTGGDWYQAVPGYLGLAQNGLYVGTSQFGVGASPYAARSGPIFAVKASDNLAQYAPCVAGSNTCNVTESGTGYWQGSFQPKRMISIYDGPHFADGNTFVNVGAWECDPQPCRNKPPGTCVLPALPCGVYSSTVQPQSPTNPGNMIIPDAGIGWKQPNGFFYPPAFTYRRNAFFKNLPQGLPAPPAGEDPLNQCFSEGPPDYVTLKKRPGDCRHNVIDRTQNYVQGNMRGLNAASPQVFSAADNQLQDSTIDFSTILVDLDATLTGASGMIDGLSTAQPTTSVSRNHFFDAPSQSPECQAFGVQTSPYAFVTTAMARLRQSPSSSGNSINPGGWPGTPLVALYRQWKLASDQGQTCTQVCSEDNPFKYGCPRATFMGMANIFQSSYLTMTEPPGLPASQPGAPYYIDTNSGRQSTQCITTKTGDMQPAPFVGNDSYLLYNLFPRPESKTRYQLYVGTAMTLDDIEGRFVRVALRDGTGNSSPVNQPCDPRQNGTWCQGMKAEIQDGILTVALDHAPLASQFEISAQPSYQQCMPRNLCFFNTKTNLCQPCSTSPSSCTNQGDFLQADIASMSRPDANGANPLDTVCTTWASLTSGKTKVGAADVSFVDCPAGGCLGFAFKLPNGFAPLPYAQVESQKKLSRCFFEAAWMSDALKERMANGGAADPLCGAPRAQAASDFCTDSELALMASQDAHIQENAPSENQGDDHLLHVDGGNNGESAAAARSMSLGAASAVLQGGRVRSLVGFDRDAIDTFIANNDGLTSAFLVLTTAATEGHRGETDLIDVHRLHGDFVEGDGDFEDHELHEERPAAAGPSAALASPLAGPPALGGKRPRLARRVGGKEAAPGVTWNCAVDANTANEHPGDCHDHWDADGGDHGAATAPPVAIGEVDEVLAWDVTDDVNAGASSWIIRKRDEADPTGIAFHSREGAAHERNSDLAPTLILR